MSLIVGIRCTDSIVLAASGPETLPSEDGLAPARQRARKLRVVGGMAVLGVSGHDGLAQEMALSLERSLTESDHQDVAEDVLRSSIRDALAAPVQRTVAIHKTLQGLPGFGITSNDYVLSQSMVAIPFQDSTRLYALDPECSLTEITDEHTYAAIGNTTVAGPLLAFLREVMWQNGVPNQANGELAAYWTVRHAVENTPAGLAHPIQLVVMVRRQDGSIEIIERGDRELAAIGQVMETSLEAMRRSFATQPHASGSGGGPKPPPVPTAKPTRKRVPEVRLRLEPPDQGTGRDRW